MNIAVIIPAFNEEQAIPLVLEELQRDIARLPWISSAQIVVADNGSTDRTAALARAGGAKVVTASRRGYGSACQAGLAAVTSADTVVFVDADHSVDLADLEVLLAPLADGRADLVLGARTQVEDGALTVPQRFGNRLACLLMRWIYRHRYADLGPFRAIRWKALQSLQMQDPAFGWTIEMQIKALRRGLQVVEVPVRCRKRIGQSKISGTFMGSIKAGEAILRTIAKYSYGSRS